jgi:hypothetical protein
MPRRFLPRTPRRPDDAPWPDERAADFGSQAAFARRYRSPYDEDEEDLDIGSRGGYRPPSSAGLIASISSLIGIGLLIIIGVLCWVLFAESDPEGSRLLVFCLFFLDLAAFVSSIISLVQGLRAQNPMNYLYRRHGLFGLICGIINLLLSLVVGLVVLCAGLLLLIQLG